MSMNKSAAQRSVARRSALTKLATGAQETTVDTPITAENPLRIPRTFFDAGTGRLPALVPLDRAESSAPRSPVYSVGASGDQFVWSSYREKPSLGPLWGFVPGFVEDGYNALEPGSDKYNAYAGIINDTGADPRFTKKYLSTLRDTLGSVRGKEWSGWYPGSHAEDRFNDMNGTFHKSWFNATNGLPIKVESQAMVAHK